MQLNALDRLYYASAIACGVLAALGVHILLSVSGFGLAQAWHGAAATNAQQVTAALAWWGTGVAGFVVAWVIGAYLIASARGRATLGVWARRLLIAVVLAGCTAAGVMSKNAGGATTAEVTASLAALALGALCAFCGARLSYLRAGHR